MSPRESERDLVRRVLTDKYGAGKVTDELVDTTIQAIAREQLGPTLQQAAVAAGEAAAAGPAGLSNAELAEALQDVAQDIKTAEVRQVRLVVTAWQRGWSLRKTAGHLGISYQTVANILERQADAG